MQYKHQKIKKRDLSNINTKKNIFLDNYFKIFNE